MAVCGRLVWCWLPLWRRKDEGKRSTLTRAEQINEIRPRCCIGWTVLVADMVVPVVAAFDWPWAVVWSTALAAVAAWFWLRRDGAATADESLGESVEAERLKLTPAKFCSSCGKESGALRVCNGCKCVCYCDESCQKNHRDEHKKKCTRIKAVLHQRGGKLDVGTEFDLGPLGKVPPREECPICMHTLPIHAWLSTHKSCCGKTICGGCWHQQKMKSDEQTCAFCRTAVPESDEEILARNRKRVERKDPEALFSMSMYYHDGDHGLPVDHAKCIELLRESADLGHPCALHELGIVYDAGTMGLDQNEEEAIKCWEKAAEGGQVLSRHNLGCMEGRNGDDVAALRHFRLSALGGLKASMDSLLARFEDGLLRHGDLGETLQAFYIARAEMRSEDRDLYIEYLKNTEYSAFVDLCQAAIAFVITYAITIIVIIHALDPFFMVQRWGVAWRE